MKRNIISRLKNFQRDIQAYQKIYFVRYNSADVRLSCKNDAIRLREKLNKTYSELEPKIKKAAHDIEIPPHVFVGGFPVLVFQTAFVSTGELIYITPCIDRSLDIVSQVIGYYSDKRETLLGTIEEYASEKFIEVKKQIKIKNRTISIQIDKIEQLLRQAPIDGNAILLACRNLILIFSNRGKKDIAVKKEIDKKGKQLGERNYAWTYLSHKGLSKFGLEVMEEIYRLGSAGKGDIETGKVDKMLFLLQFFLNEYINTDIKKA